MSTSSPAFGIVCLDDSFAGATLKPEWTVSIPKDGPTIAVQNGLKITVPEVVFDSWSFIADAPDIHVPAPNGDFTVSARLTDASYPDGTPVGGNFHSAVIVAFGPLDILYWGASQAPERIRLDRAGVGNLGEVVVGSLPASFRIARIGNEYTFQYKEENGAEWFPLQDANGAPIRVTETKPPTHVGILQKTWSAIPMSATWMDFLLDAESCTVVGDIKGTVATSASNPGEIGVRIINAQGAVVATVVPEANGSYTSPKLPTGAYTVQLFGTGLTGPAADRRKTVTVAGNQTATVNFDGVSVLPDLGAGNNRIFTDDFAGTTLKSDWQTVTPAVGPTVTVNNALKISLPDIAAFDQWVGVNRAPRVVVPAPAGDFYVSTRILPAVNSTGDPVDGANYQTSLVVMFGDATTDYIAYGLSTTNGIVNITRSGGGGTDFTLESPISLQIRKDGFNYSFWYRTTETGEWNQLTDANGVAVTRTILEAPLAVGLLTKTWANIDVSGSFDDFALEATNLPKWGTISGTITTSRPGPELISVRIVNRNGEIVAVVPVAASGSYSLVVPQGDYAAYLASDEISNPATAVNDNVTVTEGGTTTVDFSSLALKPEPRRSNIFTDPFDGSVLNARWKVTNQDNLATLTVAGGNFSIAMPEGLFDHWVNINGAPRISTPLSAHGLTAGDDWAASARFEGTAGESGEPFNGNNFHAVLPVFFAEDEIPALMYGIFTSNQQLRVEYNGQNSLSNAAFENPPIWVEVRKSGVDYTFWYKTRDDGPWIPMKNTQGGTYVYTKPEAPSAVGLEDKTWPSPAHTSTWSEFRLDRLTTAPSVVMGDLNTDGRVNVQDATVSLRIAVGLVTPTTEQAAAGNVNGDAALNLQDTTLILRAAVGLIGTWPNGTPVAKG